MKKNYTLIVLLVLTTSIVFSQPTITYSGNAPQIGDMFYFSVNEESIDPGPSGANQNWDFSDFNVTSNFETSIMAPGNTPFASDFPECNQVNHFDGTTTYTYYDLSQSEMNHYGEGFEDNPPLIIYFTDPVKQIEFPFAYNDSFDDDYASSKVYEGLTWHTYGTNTTTADAWGSVTTPEDTYNSVLRVLSERTQVDSVFIEDMFMYATITTYSHYGWHTASSHTPVMAISINESDQGTFYCSHYTTSSQHVISPIAGINSLKVSPNPANDLLQISFEAEDNSRIQISIIDLTGREILSSEYVSNNSGDQLTTMDLEKIDAGLYFVKISNGKKTLSKKIIVR